MTAWWQLAVCLAVVALVTAALQRFAMTFTPQRDWERPEAKPQHILGDAIAACMGLTLAGLFLLLTGRPVASALLALTVVLFLVLVNYAKLQILREPLILADAWLLRQIFRYPHLYFPFLPVRTLLVVLALVCVCVAFLFYAETNIVFPAPLPVKLVLLLPAFGPMLLQFLLRQGKLSGLGSRLLRHCPVSHDAATDARRSGPMASAMLHPVLAGKMEKQGGQVTDFLRSPDVKPSASHWPSAFETVLAETDNPSAETLPHILLIQAESLCDIRTLLSPEQNAALGDFLPNLAALERAGHVLPTPESAFGAYTMRTEFSMLTGLSQETLGPFAHNPYLQAERRPFWSLARHLGRKGYESICLHPYAKDFFRRDKVMPNLGFAHFIGQEELGDLERFGPYVSDQALGRWMIDRLERSPRPVFCFTITMEAHGPWLPGRLTEDQIASCLPDKARPLLSLQTQFYLCHLRNLDRMLGTLLAAQEQLPRPVRLLVYGDHAPSLRNPRQA